jgi:hypothetical protein
LSIEYRGREDGSGSTSRLLIVIGLVLIPGCWLVVGGGGQFYGKRPRPTWPPDDGNRPTSARRLRRSSSPSSRSPAHQLTQVITVDLGNGETITVTSESGVFTAPFDTFPKEITIDLLPNTTHNLTVEGRVREVVQGDCTYGGYTLSTTMDRNGGPLQIVTSD